jgi:serine/threonine-protein kinase HipA
MRRCPLTYAPLAFGEEKYSGKGLRRFSPQLHHLEDLPYTALEQRQEAANRSVKMSIQGIQPKISARLLVKQGRFEFMDQGGHYILKPQSDVYPHLPENEDLTMRLAALIGLDIPLHGLIYSKDGTLTYVIKRFDRQGRGRKISVEDFAQLLGETRETKYDSSMEKAATVIDNFCTFPLAEKKKLFQLTLFSFLVGNEDMHLKNFSLLTENGITVLSPIYDLVNSTIVLRNPAEEMALPIRGKRNRLTKEDFLVYYAQERLGLPLKIITGTLETIFRSLNAFSDLIDTSFLPLDKKEAYKEVLQIRWARLF